MRALEDFSEVSKTFDRYGSTRLRERVAKYLDLTQLSAPFIPTDLPNFFHHYYDTSGVAHSVTLGIESAFVSSLFDIETLLSPTIGLHYLFYVESLPTRMRVRYRTIGINTLHALGSIVKPKTMTEWLAEWKVSNIDLSRFPHECRRCGAPAYIGANLVDCSAGCR